MITNQGWKAVAIGASTAQNFPQSLTVSNVFLGGYTDSFNVLLLNYAGYGVPLTASSINVGSNSAMTILASAVNVTNTGSSRLEVGGTVNQGEFPAVNTRILSLGNIGPGIYNLTNGTLTVVTGYVGGRFTGQLNQYGGYNSVSTLSILGTGEYDIYDGALGGAVELQNGSLLRQRGGTFVGSVWFDGTYELDGGSFTNSNLLIPVTDNGYTVGYPAGEMLQTGGTNQTGSIYLGGRGTGDMLYYSPVSGAYVLSNGLLVATSGFLDVGGIVTQTGGTFINSGQLTLNADLLHTGGLQFFCGEYDLQGGSLAENSIVSSGFFTQSGGTNQVAGSTRIASIPSEGNNVAYYSLSGGSFTTAGLSLSNAVITQSGGSLFPGNLSISANLAPGFFTTSFGYFGYDLSGGELTVSSLQLGGYAVFHHRGGGLVESGLLALAGGLWDEQTSGQQFGQLLLSAPAGSNANFSLPSGNCTVRFANSSAQAWNAGAILSITNWHGSPSGGGASQFYFGSGASGLTPQQLSQIVFTNPAGFASGSYPSKILSTGEIVPDSSTTPPPGLVNNWINPSSDKWEHSSSWSLGALPASNQTVNITNAGYKAVNIDSATVSGFPNSLTVSNLTLGITPSAANTLLLNYAGTTTPLRVLNNLDVQTNGHLLMIESGLTFSNTLSLGGVVDQQGGELNFTNPAAIVQVEGGHFNVTNGTVNGADFYLGGASDGYANQDGGLVTLTWLGLGNKPTVPGSRGAGTYSLQSGWLTSGIEVVGNNGFGTLTQNGGTNSASIISLGNGTYAKNSGGLFGGEVDVFNASSLTHGGGATTVTNLIRMNGQGNNAALNILGGSVSTPRIELVSSARVTQSNGTMNVTGELFMQENAANSGPVAYYLYNGNLFTSRTTVASSRGSTIMQFGGTHITGTLSITDGSSSSYKLTGGTLSAQNIVLYGQLNFPAQFVVIGAPAFAITNQSISSYGGGIVIQDSAQQFGSLSLPADSSISLAGNSAVLRFADSHTNSWQSGVIWMATPQLLVSNWNGSANGGAADQLIFGTSAAALTPSQVAQIHFVNPAGFPSGTYPAKILSTGEVVPVLGPTLLSSRSGSSLVMTWYGNYQLLSATNLAGPWTPVSGATSPWTNHFTKPQEFFKLQGM